VAGDGLAYLTTGFRGSALLAVRTDRTGDLTDTEAIAWSYNKDTPYVPSPLLYENRLYLTKVNTGVLTCLDAKSGAPVFGPQRLEGLESMYASPVAAAEHIYFVGRDGTTVVIRSGEKLEILATNKLDDAIDASPALVGNELFLRGKEYLYCIREK
jgi:outer membrane protein assembly factor BamB